MRQILGALVAVTLLAAGGCDGSTDASPEPAPATSSTPTEPTATPPPRATPAPRPAADACYDLTYDEAVAPTASMKTVPCKRRHSAQTYFVGEVANVVDGHLLAVDSDRVQQHVAASCPAKLAAAVGGSRDDVRLSMLRAVWFTPTVEQSDEGAAWYRCDVVALAGAEELADVRGSLEGILDTDAGRNTYGMCGTAGPDEPGFTRVPCGDEHSWRAFSVIDLPGGRYPGRPAVTQAGETPCQEAAADIADDPLDYEWGFEGPDAEQWAAGQTFVRCWAPD
ncbi:hypothetical protein BH11ACT8_BH11ACT8_07180 [soil metagenome]